MFVLVSRTPSNQKSFSAASTRRVIVDHEPRPSFDARVDELQRKQNMLRADAMTKVRRENADLFNAAVKRGNASYRPMEPLTVAISPRTL
jgi:hypothetical protein